MTGPVRPPTLRPGSRVALVAPGGPVDEERLEAAIADCHALGFEPVPGAAALQRLGYLAGTDAERAADLANAFRDPGIDAVWALRGGYGAMRILPDVDLEPLRRWPRAFIGFSDNTAIHLALSRLGIVSYHGPHPGALGTDFSRACLYDVLCTGRTPGLLPAAPDGESTLTIAGGVAEGPLTGGNLSMLAASCGTPWALQADGAILVIEDVNEPAYRIDRAFTQLRLAGSLDGLAGIAFGRFTDRPPENHDRPLEDVLAEISAPLGVPVISGVPVGHIDAQWTLPLGTRARLDADRGRIEILEAGTGDIV